MKYFKKLGSIVVFILFMFCTLLLSLNYSFGKYSFLDENLYGLSDNYIAFEQISENSYDYGELFNIDKDDNLVLISTTEKQSTIGLYDPQMQYYTGASKETILGQLRYFSFDDYVKKNAVAIAIGQCIYTEYAFTHMENSYNVDDMLTCLDYSELDEPNITVAKNLFSLKSQSGSKLFIDSNDTSLLHEFTKSLEEKGFVEVDKVESEINIRSSLKNSLMNKYDSYLLIASLALLILYVVVSFSHIAKDKHKIVVHQASGGRYWRMLKELYLSIFIKSFMLCLGSYVLLLAINYFNKGNYTSIKNFVILLCCYFIYIIAIFIINYSVLFYRLKNKVRYRE